MTEQLMELADRCEKASGPDRELDALIWCALNRKKYVSHNPAYGHDLETQVEFTEPPKRSPLVTGPRTGGHARPVTASLDAAMQIVPEGCSLNIIRAADGRGANAALYRFGGNSERIPSTKHSGSAATPALALTVAALRARAQSENLGGGDE